jgi:hypothetical protein
MPIDRANFVDRQQTRCMPANALPSTRSGVKESLIQKSTFGRLRKRHQGEIFLFLLSHWQPTVTTVPVHRWIVARRAQILAFAHGPFGVVSRDNYRTK